MLVCALTKEQGEEAPAERSEAPANELVSEVTRVLCAQDARSDGGARAAKASKRDVPSGVSWAKATKC